MSISKREMDVDAEKAIPITSQTHHDNDASSSTSISSSPNTGQITELTSSPSHPENKNEADATAIPDPMVTNVLQRWANKLTKITGAEGRGIERVDEDLRTAPPSLSQYCDMGMIWFSVNLTANILTIGVMGPTTFALGALDSMMCCFWGTVFGSIITCYMATYGPLSGCRSLVVARYTMGWWATKLCVLLAVVVILGYGLVGAITTGLLFSAVSGGSLSTIAGIIVFGVIVWVVSMFGISHLQLYERYASIPQICVLFVLVGISAPYMDPHAKSALTGTTLVGARVSYFFVCASGPMGWAPFIADSFCYYSPKTSRWGIITVTFLGFVASKTFVEFVGIGLGTGLATQETWASGFSALGVGGLLMAAYAPLGVFGKFCAVIMGLGIAANMVPGNYSAAFCAPLLASKAAKIPRLVWNTVATIIFVAVAIPGRDKLLPIFSNFLPLIGYWVIIWITLSAEEEWLFRRRNIAFTGLQSLNYDWTAWDEPKKLPLGIAAFTAFIIGWVGAILCMNQAYYTGPIAKLAGGADLGLPVAAAWAGILYPVLRWWEIKKFGR